MQNTENVARETDNLKIREDIENTEEDAFKEVAEKCVNLPRQNTSSSEVLEKLQEDWPQSNQFKVHKIRDTISVMRRKDQTIE